MQTKAFERYDGASVTDHMLGEAAQLFSQNYGIWGTGATEFVGPFAKKGAAVKMSKERLRAECLPPDAECVYVKVTVNGILAGHVLACRWSCGDKTICWITQLVVHRNYRERGLARGLLHELKQDSDDFYGIASSHPAACLAATRAFGRTIGNVHLSLIGDRGRRIMSSSPIGYIKNATPRGSLFEPNVTDGTISCVDTGFFVDHEEPLEALRRVREDTDWPLGELLEGHEFLLILEARRRPRSKSRSTALP